MKNFLYLQFGKETFRKELVTSLISLIRSMGDGQDYRIVVLTDQPEALREELRNRGITLPENSVRIHKITSDLLNEWTNHGMYCYSSKAKAIGWFFDNYREDVIFLDTDTVIYKDLRPLFQELGEYSLMNFQCRGIKEVLTMVKERPWNIEDECILTRFQQRIHCFELIKEEMRCLKIQEQFQQPDKIFNSGVIGISYRKKKVIDQVLTFIEYIYKNTKYKASEEVAFSIILQLHGKVKTVDEYLVHYYECKETRLIATYLLNLLSEEEHQQLRSLLELYGVWNIGIYEIQLNECNAFMDYLRLYRGKIEPYYGNRFEGECYTSQEKIETWEKLNRRCFRKWIKNENRNKEG